MRNFKLSQITELAQLIGKSLLLFGKLKQGSEQGRKNRMEMELLHTSGSKSHARVSHEMHKKNGYPPQRHELFIETHTCKKTGAPSSVAAATMFKKIEEKSNEHPELLEKSIKQGDLFSHVAGKERNGYVRCIGLGPSAARLGMPGTRKLKSMKLQMAEEEAKEARQANAILVERVDKMEHNFQTVVTTLKDELQQMRRLLQSNVQQNIQFNPDYDLSHSGYGYGYRHEGGYGGGHGGGYRHEDGYEGGYGGGYGHEGGYEHEGEYEHEESAESATHSHEVRQEKQATILHKKAEEALLQKKLTAPTQKNFVLSSTALHEVLQEKESTILQKKKATGLTQQSKDVALHRHKMATSKEVAITQKNQQKGKDVILYNVYRDHCILVAKATILSIDRRKVVGGQELGSEYCEVAVNYVIKRVAILPRGVGNMTTMGQVQGRCIAWPYKHLEVDKSMEKAGTRPQAS
ncbi:uncharacterized protein [Aegilops tauschii subsp. strangulata]|uniref:uncharacterized protein isoform X2 n=1 Tax=Aegilops tauschii subsp. strangulata TaxID=200361 RepID=UPI00098B750E|nr:uncharacterized protein LOC109750538 isoform X2 [Aegilops tauschii subsp. strangulata]